MGAAGCRSCRQDRQWWPEGTPPGQAALSGPKIQQRWPVRHEKSQNPLKRGVSHAVVLAYGSGCCAQRLVRLAGGREVGTQRGPDGQSLKTVEKQQRARKSMSTCVKRLLSDRSKAIYRSLKTFQSYNLLKMSKPV